MTAPIILIVSTDAVVAALLGTLVELDGYHPVFPERHELPIDALVRHSPALVLVDCDATDACASSFFAASAARSAGVVLFSHARLQPEVEEIATRHGLSAFALPVERAALARILAEAMVLFLLWVRPA